MNSKQLFQQIPSIKLYEPLYDFFGISDDGIVEFSFLDAVKIAGHACPTVAGAYLMSLHGLKALYRDELPVRGNFEILFSENEAEGVTGVISNVMGAIIGANGIGGFKGLAGQFARNNRLHYDQTISCKVAIKRLDNNQMVNISYHPEIIPSAKEVSPLLSKIISKQANDLEIKEFKTLWNQRLEKILSLGSKESEIIQIS